MKARVSIKGIVALVCGLLALIAIAFLSAICLNFCLLT